MVRNFSYITKNKTGLIVEQTTAIVILEKMRGTNILFGNLCGRTNGIFLKKKKLCDNGIPACAGRTMESK